MSNCERPQLLLQSDPMVIELVAELRERGATFPSAWRATVRFPGLVYRPKSSRDYGPLAQSVRILPSLYEGFGLPVLEADGRRRACRSPARIPSSLPEVAGDAALLFDPRDEAAMVARPAAACSADPR